MTIGLAMIVSGMMANPLATDQTNLTKPQPVEIAQSVTTETAKTDKDAESDKKDEAPKIIKTNAGIESSVRAYFADVPLMAEVARCESHYRQYDKQGNIFRGVVNNKDVGIMQINERYHLERSKKLGINIYSVEGNLKYARLLYNEQGAGPWSSSSPCWGKTSAAKAKVNLAIETPVIDVIK